TLIRQPPVPTLFPYTTLFRSGIERQALAHQNETGKQRRHRRVALRIDQGKQRPGGKRRRLALFVLCGERRRSRDPECQVEKISADRKSTRLNSSHLGSAYAVF